MSQGVWAETLASCKERLLLARAIRVTNAGKARKLIAEAHEDAEVVREWAAMTRFLEEVRSKALEGAE
jgi:hypothetical protein